MTIVHGKVCLDQVNQVTCDVNHDVDHTDDPIFTQNGLMYIRLSHFGAE